MHQQKVFLSTLHGRCHNFCIATKLKHDSHLSGNAVVSQPAVKSLQGTHRQDDIVGVVTAQRHHHVEAQQLQLREAQMPLCQSAEGGAVAPAAKEGAGDVVIQHDRRRTSPPIDV